MTKYHRLVASALEISFSTIQEYKSLTSRCCQGWFLLRPSPWFVHDSLLPVSSHGLPSVSACVLTSSCYKDTSHIGLGPMLATLFFSLIFLTWGYVHWFLRVREKHQCARETSIGCLPYMPNWGSNPPSRYVPWLGVKPAAIWYMGRHFNSWAPWPGPVTLF